MSAVLEFQAAPGKPVLRGIAFFWDVIRQLQEKDGGFSIHAVLQQTNRTDRSTVKDYVQRLLKAGYIEDTGERDALYRGGETPLYRLVRASAAAPRLNRDGTVARQGSGQQQMWNVLRGPESRTGIKASDLALRASTEDVPVTVEAAKSYLRRLASADYLIHVRHGLWKLQPNKNTGPKPPLVLKSKIVFDQNKQVAMAPIVAEEDRP